MDPKINRWLYSEWRNRSIDEKLIAIASRTGKNHMWLALLDDEPYGLITVGDISRVDKSGVIWYLRGSNMVRYPGVMTECVKLAIQHAFSKLDLHSVSASTQAGNLASERLLRALGFRLVGTMREAFLVNGNFVDRNLFDLLAQDLTSNL